MQRVEPRARFVWAARALVPAAVVGGALWVVRRFFVMTFPGYLPAAGFVLVATLGVAHALGRYRRFRFDLREDELYLERGVVTHVSTLVPFVRVQHVDSRRGPVERATGLASVVVYTAGSRGADVRIPGLSPVRATELRDHLRDLAVTTEDDDAV